MSIHMRSMVTDPHSADATDFFLYASADPRALHSFPTRRSSDLWTHAIAQLVFRRQMTTAEAHRLHRDFDDKSEEHTSELQSRRDIVCRLLLEKKNRCQSHFFV